MKIEIRRGDPRSLKLLDLNARYMRHEQFQQLVTNVRKDQVLTSTPFVWRDTETGDGHVLSGNHRVKAAIEAGLEEIVWLETEEPLTEEERIAIQLSHNAIAGEDDLAILKTLYERIGDLNLREYAGLDDATLENLAELDSPSISEANLSFQTLAIVFLPDDLKDAQDTIRDAIALAASADDVWVAQLRQYDQVMAGLDLASKSYDVTNVATAFGVILESFRSHADEITDGWFNRDTGEARHHGMAPLLTLFHTDAMPAASAAVVERALQAAVGRGDVPAEHRYKALELWARTYLDQPEQAHA
ncbi:ParB N-terminal domain-containing protein [Streptomyces sp. NPDC056291]|uniref:ParB N-terminal domain-containing protein n=1 Tax=Streptomyces sp. NPDC056291 TaxID=3345772 RepID=UPI0035D7FECE